MFASLMMSLFMYPGIVVTRTIKQIYVRRMQDLETIHLTYRIVSIEVSSHTPDTLTDAVQEALNTACGSGVFTVAYDERKLKLPITTESQSELELFTDDELKGINDWSGPAFNSSDLLSANELLGNYTAQSLTAQTFKSGIVDLRRYHNVYISSGNLSS